MSSPSSDDISRQLSSAAEKRISTNEDGSLDVLGSVGGIRGIIEAALPATVFLTAYLISGELLVGIGVAIGVGVIFTVLRLVQRGPLVQSCSGLVGVLICAAFAYFSGEARSYYVPGFFINAGYILGLGVSIAVKWPVMGILFGVIRGQSFDWRKDQLQRRRYAMATWLIIGVLAARLIVQVPFYYAENETALGISRVVMGVPLYAFALWWGWMITRDRQPSTPQ